MGSNGTNPFVLGITIAAYLALNSSLNMMNRWALGLYGFSFPIFMTVCHMTFSCIALAPLMASKGYRGLHADTLQRQWKGLVYIGVFLAANISLNNISLVTISLSLNQIIRASIPVVTALLAYSVEGRTTSQAEMASLAVLSSGVMLAVWQGSVSGTTVGVLFCVMATVSNAAMMTWSGKVMSERIDALRLAFYTAPVSCAVLLPFLAAREWDELVRYASGKGCTEIAAIILVGSANALAYNVVHYLMIQMTSAVTTTVLGMIKIVGLVILSSVLLGEAQVFTLSMTVGALLTLGGFCAYSWIRMTAPPPTSGVAPPRRPPSPKLMSSDPDDSDEEAAQQRKSPLLDKTSGGGAEMVKLVATDDGSPVKGGKTFKM